MRRPLPLVLGGLLAAIPTGLALAGPAPSRPTVVEVAASDPRFSTLVAAVKAAGLVDTLSGPGPFTVLAPTDDAFRALPAGTVETLLRPENASRLAAVLSYHVLPGRWTAADLARGEPARTALGPAVAAGFRGGRLEVAGAPVIATDVVAGNGVIHVLGAVLLPPTAPDATPSPDRRARARAVADRALDVGVPLYNAGNPDACAAAYELGARGLALLGDDVVPADVRSVLLAAADAAGSGTARAWELRRALDRARAALAPTAATPPAPVAPPAAPPVAATVAAPLDRAAAADALARAVAALDAGDRSGALARVDDLVRRLGADSRIAASLADAAAAARAGGAPEAATLRRVAAERADDLRFEPQREAETPAGWPTPTTVGEVEVKRYPAYRVAKAEGAGNVGFWTLFRHIKANDIAMTAPVVMEYERTDGSSSGSMGFLYGDPATGRTGRDGAVEVVDVPASTVASFGVRGPLTSRVLDDARAALEAWLARHPEWAAAAPVRTLGWNSPFVERGRQYFEVQLPLTPRATTGRR